MEDYTTTKTPLNPVQDEPSLSHTVMAGFMRTICSFLAYFCSKECLVDGKFYFNMCHFYSLMGILVGLIFLAIFVLFAVIVKDQAIVDFILDVCAIVFRFDRPSSQVFELEEIESPTFESFQRPKLQSIRRRKVLPGGDVAAHDYL